MYPVVYATQTQFSVLLTISHSKVNVTFIMQKHCRTERGFVEIMQLVAYYFIETVLNQRKDISNWLSINQTATSTFPFKKTSFETNSCSLEPFVPCKSKVEIDLML